MPDIELNLADPCEDSDIDEDTY